MIDIKDITGKAILSVPITEASVRRFLLMKEDSVTLVFTLAEPAAIGIGDRVDVDGTPYYLTETVYPEYDPENGGYRYSIRFDSHYYRWKSHILFYDRQGNREAAWSLTRSPEAHLGIIVSNLRSLGFTYNGKPYTAIVGSGVKADARLVTYDSTNIIDALTRIAETWECEWWVIGETIYLGRLERTEDPARLEIGLEAATMSRTKSQDLYATRLYVFGGDRNIPPGYREGETGTTVEGVVKHRLMLPAGTPYIDVIDGQREDEAIEAVIVIDDIYPRIIGAMTAVESKEITDTDPETGDTTRFTVYRFKDSGFPFSKDYLLPGAGLRITFESGTLNGMEFAVAFNPDGLPESDPGAQVFEIVRNSDYGQTLPAAPLTPHTGDRYVLSGFNTSYVSDELVPKAERELLERALALKEKATADPSTYTVTLNSYRASGYDDRNGTLNPELSIDLQPGSRVELVNPGYFDTPRRSRVIGYEKKLDYPYDSPAYTIGETASYSRIGELEGKIETLQYKGNTYVNQGGTGGGAGVYIVRKDDTTAASDENVFSALRTLYEIDKQRLAVDQMYLRKDIDDTARGNILFERNIGSSIYTEGFSGRGWRIENTGLATMEGLNARSDIFMGGKTGSPSFASGFTGWGWEIDTPTASGTVDNWTVRKSMKVYELVYSQIYGLSGSTMVTDFNKIKEVTTTPDGSYHCTLDDMDGTMFVNLREGDIVRVQKRDGWNIRYYYAEVSNVTPDAFDLKVVEGEDTPAAGDVAFRMGNLTDKNRQGLIYLTSSDDYASYIDILDDIDRPGFSPANTKVRLGNLRGIRVGGKPLDMYGIYINGGIFQHSEYYLDNGDTIDQRFDIMDGRFSSLIGGTQSDISGTEGNILKNASFGLHADYWETAGNTHYIPVTDGFLWVPSAFYVDKQTAADMYLDNGRYVLRILNSSVKQYNVAMTIPTHEAIKIPGMQQSQPGKNPVTGEPTGGPVQDTPEQSVELPEYEYSFSLHYKVLRAGTLTVGVPGSEIYAQEALSPDETDEYRLFYKAGKWNEIGDFVISFTGEILIYGVTLRNDSAADNRLLLQTGIEQTVEQIRLWASKELATKTGEVNARWESELKITAEAIDQRVTKTQYAEDTKQVTEKYESFIKTTAESIQGISTKYDTLSNTISTAGWITSKDGLDLFAAKEMEDGENIVAAINLQPDTIKIRAKNLQLKGAVTFELFDQDTKDKLALKGDIIDDYNSLKNTPSLSDFITGTALEGKGYITLADIPAPDLSEYVKSETLSGILSDYEGAGAAETAKKEILGALLSGDTEIIGGYIGTSLIDTKTIYAGMAEIGGFTIESNGLYSGTSNSAYIKFGSDMILTSGQLNIKDPDHNIEAIFGGVSYSSGEFWPCVLKNKYYNSIHGNQGGCISMFVGTAGKSYTPQTWIRCTSDNVNAQFKVEARNPFNNGVASSDRTFIWAGCLPLRSHAEAMVGSPCVAYKVVYVYNENGNGLFAIE